jgi:ubiquinone/menaquinone biosynthesis C-methylase UbiE
VEHLRGGRPAKASVTKAAAAVEFSKHEGEGDLVSEGHTEIPEERIFFFDQQEVAVQDFEAPGLILDIGGGGEGIIGRLKGEQVVAIDPSRRELEEAPSGPLKIVMDATDLQFLDSSFLTATSFFTLMYIKASDHEQVFGEVFRVLKPGGRFLIWEVKLPPRLDEDKDLAAFPLVIRLPGDEVETGYGVSWPMKEQDLGYYLALAAKVGSQVVDRGEKGHTIFLELRKPQP